MFPKSDLEVLPKLMLNLLTQQKYNTKQIDISVKSVKGDTYYQNSCTRVYNNLTAHNWQKWKRVFLTCPCHEIYRDEAVGLKSYKYAWKITI